jgi:hypothetical protein
VAKCPVIFTLFHEETSEKQKLVENEWLYAKDQVTSGSSMAEKGGWKRSSTWSDEEDSFLI